jgi:hypothetical protein
MDAGSVGEVGGVAGAVAAFVAGLGELTERQAVAAAQAQRLAVLLDDNEAGSAASALARELRLTVALLGSRVTIPANAPVAVTPDPSPDPVERIRDEVARKRQQRASSA